MRAAHALLLILAWMPAVAAAKPQPPVRVEAEVSLAGAVVRLQFAVAAQQVEVQVRGVDGLALLQPTRRLARRDVAAGGCAQLTVGFEQEVPQGTLVVSVEGRFANERQRLVRTFSVGAPLPAPTTQKKMLRGHRGRPLHLLPAS